MMLLDLISNTGFAVFVACFLLFRLEKSINKLIEHTIKLEKSIAKNSDNNKNDSAQFFLRLDNTLQQLDRNLDHLKDSIQSMDNINSKTHSNLVAIVNKQMALLEDLKRGA